MKLSTDGINTIMTQKMNEIKHYDTGARQGIIAVIKEVSSFSFKQTAINLNLDIYIVT